MGMIRKICFFLLGGIGYVGLELLWRGRSHISMFAAGGTCFLLLGALQKKKLPPAVHALLGAGIITAVELIVGLLFNRQYEIWDYRRMPINFLGQICLPFSLLWIPLSLGAMSLYRYLDQRPSKQ